MDEKEEHYEEKEKNEMDEKSVEKTMIISFKSELTQGKDLRIFGTGDFPWFVGKDIADFLGYKDTEQAVRKNVEEEDKILWCILRKVAPSPETGQDLPENISKNIDGMRHNSVLINESGLYSLIMSSKLEKAKIFKRWITREVIPSIRKNRMYQLEAGSMISSLIPEITMVPQDPLKEEALQLAKKVDRTVCANTPCMLAEPTQSLRDMYIYYVGNRTVKAGFSKDVMPIRDRCHQKDVEFADCILVFVCKCRSSIEEEIHKQLWNLRANKLKTGKRETYVIEEGGTLQEFIDMISKYIEI